MKQFFLLLLLIITPVLLFSQNITVKSFQQLSTALDARVNYPKLDQNGDKCAIVKVVTTENDFTWDGDNLGIIAIEKKTGEYWLYVPHGSKRLTIKHEKFGVLKDYAYPESILEATVYEMVLSTSREEDTKTQWLIIVAEPENAIIFIDNKKEAPGFYKKMHKPGTYHYRVEAPLYHPNTGTVVITSDKGNSISIALKPNFGFAQITSLPKKKAQVFIDGVETNLLTPCTTVKMISGAHDISITRWGFQPLTQKVIIKDEKTEQVIFTMKSNRSSTKDFYKNHIISLSAGYNNTFFSMERFSNSNIKKKLGYSATLDVNLFPFFFDLSYFSMRFLAKELEWVNFNQVYVTNAYRYWGIQLSLDYVPYSLGANIYPYFGTGFVFSSLGSRTEGEFSLMIKTGVKIRLQKYFVFGEYKRQFDETWQIYSGVGVIF